MKARPAIILHRTAPRSYCPDAWALNLVLDNGAVFHAVVDDREHLIEYIENEFDDPCFE